MKYSHRKKYILAGAILFSAVASYFSTPQHAQLIGLSINSYYVQILMFIGINIMLAVSLNLINGYTGQFSLGHAGFMAIGAYVSGYLSTEHSAGFFRAFGGVNAWTIAGLFLSVLIAGGFAAALAGLLVGVPSLRLKGDYLAIVTLGFGEIIRVLIQNTDAVGGPRGYSGIAGYTTLFWTYALAAVTIYVVVSLIDSTYGRGFLTVRDDEIAAEAVGINTTRYKVTAFVLGAFFAGIAGGLYAHSTTYINPSGFDFQRSIEIVIMVILGGMGSTVGVAFAAVLLTLLLEYLRFVAGYEWLPEFVRRIAQNRMIIYSLVLIALMLLRPQGLFGSLPRMGGRVGGVRKTPNPADPGPPVTT
jgi:branched-chain amino acid transport system permease protein